MNSIEVNIFDSKSIKRAIKRLEKEAKLLDSKCEKVCEQLINLGYDKAKMIIDQSVFSARITLNIDMKPEKSKCIAILSATGQKIQLEDGREFDVLLGIEFGAGIRYNKGNDNPWASEFGMGVGTFPNQKHAMDPKGWYYMGSDGEFHHSYGIKAQMPMYYAFEEARQKIDIVLKRVFK